MLYNGEMTMITEHNLTELDALVRQFFEIEDITYGSPKQPFVVRYRGIIDYE